MHNLWLGTLAVCCNILTSLCLFQAQMRAQWTTTQKLFFNSLKTKIKKISMQLLHIYHTCVYIPTPYVILSRRVCHHEEEEKKSTLERPGQLHAALCQKIHQVCFQTIDSPKFSFMHISLLKWKRVTNHTGKTTRGTLKYLLAKMLTEIRKNHCCKRRTQKPLCHTNSCTLLYLHYFLLIT